MPIKCIPVRGPLPADMVGHRTISNTPPQRATVYQCFTKDGATPVV